MTQTDNLNLIAQYQILSDAVVVIGQVQPQDRTEELTVEAAINNLTRARQALSNLLTIRGYKVNADGTITNAKVAKEA